ncbi:helix-turn-helix domain-containing protein [Streptomyces flavofungini]|uniref:Helix-turn-helix transcriptional regulator n=1 Tax=Streptomyces flavofungini TaxID=68200 RepID=A0ABS0WX98_9ACTN|nr:helix-turn-helix transcriptional regulator [Streptomyces flavofungini]MBJ3805560.1 helix-turn-helix transcriptional regulator [Streptomyces flavofungini]
MAIEDSPESRLRYGEELRSRREGAGLTQEELSVRAIMSRTHIAHIEAGRRRPTVEDARRLDDVLGAGGVFVRFLPSQGDGRRAERFAEALELEQRATVIRTYGPKLVPGLLQTRAYANEIFRLWYPPKSAEERDALLVTRLARAQIFDDFKSPVAWYLLDEAVLRRPIGGPAVMCGQLRHIVDLGERERIRVHVLPFEVGPHVLLDGFVSLMWFDDLPPIAYVEALNFGKVLEDPFVVRDCQGRFEHALGDSLSHQRSLALLNSVADDYEHGEQR